jgi:prepilin-type N-terminal cleavage/methylation domain-containing protein
MRDKFDRMKHYLTDRVAGFSMIEVIIALAVVTMTVAAASTAALVARKVDHAADQFMQILPAAHALQGYEAGLWERPVNNHRTLIEQTDSPDTPHWRIYRVQATEAKLRVAFTGWPDTTK